MVVVGVLWGWGVRGRKTGLMQGTWCKPTTLQNYSEVKVKNCAECPEQEQEQVAQLTLKVTGAVSVQSDFITLATQSSLLWQGRSASWR